MAPEPAAGGVWTGRSPARVNLIGEHLDYLGGPVLPAAVDRYVTVKGRPASAWAVVSSVEGGLPFAEALGAELGLAPQRVEVESDVPAGAGLASSAALLVALAAGCRPGMSGVEAALACHRAESRATGVGVGVMDQYVCALGRRGFALLLDTVALRHRAVPFPAGLVIAVVDSGVHRVLAATPYNERRREAEAGLPSRRRHVESETARVHEFAAALEAGDRSGIGRLLKESHISLRDDFEVSTPELDALAERAWCAPGCLGARIMGAGFGGSVLALLERGAEARFVAAMEGRPVLVCETADGPFAAAVEAPAR